MFDIARYYKAHSVAEAVALRQADPEARLLAGGTDVMIQLHHLNAAYRHIVDIHDLPELKGVSELPDGAIRIGSGTTFTEIIENELVKRRLPMLAEAAATIAGPQIRNVATYGGNICNGATSADSAAPTVALEAELEIAWARRHTPHPHRRFSHRPRQGGAATGGDPGGVSALPRTRTPRWDPTTSNTPCGCHGYRHHRLRRLLPD